MYLLSQPYLNISILCSIYRGLLVVLIFVACLFPGVVWLVGIVCIIVLIRLFIGVVRVCVRYIYH